MGLISDKTSTFLLKAIFISDENMKNFNILFCVNLHWPFISRFGWKIIWSILNAHEIFEILWNVFSPLEIEKFSQVWDNVEFERSSFSFFRFEQRRKYKKSWFGNFQKIKMINFKARYFLILLINLVKSDLEGSGINSDDFEGKLKYQNYIWSLLNFYVKFIFHKKFYFQMPEKL